MTIHADTSDIVRIRALQSLGGIFFPQKATISGSALFLVITVILSLFTFLTILSSVSPLSQYLDIQYIHKMPPFSEYYGLYIWSMKGYKIINLLFFKIPEVSSAFLTG